MRISDWSSDVRSSDLQDVERHFRRACSDGDHLERQRRKACQHDNDQTLLIETAGKFIELVQQAISVEDSFPHRIEQENSDGIAKQCAQKRRQCKYEGKIKTIEREWCRERVCKYEYN